jgi:hypothetical protein
MDTYPSGYYEYDRELPIHPNCRVQGTAHVKEEICILYIEISIFCET